MKLKKVMLAVVGFVVLSTLSVKIKRIVKKCIIEDEDVEERQGLLYFLNETAINYSMDTDTDTFIISLKDEIDANGETLEWFKSLGEIIEFASFKTLRIEVPMLLGKSKRNLVVYELPTDDLKTLDYTDEVKFYFSLDKYRKE